MSRRFGRNQRRRAREALVAAQVEAGRFHTAYEMTKGLLEHTSRRRDELERELSEAKEIAGFMSILFPAPTQHISRPRDNRATWQVPAPSRLSYEAMETRLHQSMDTLRIMPLPLLITRIDTDALAQAVHVHVSFDGKETCYAVSSMGIAVTPRRQMERIISTQVAADLARKIYIGRRW